MAPGLGVGYTVNDYYIKKNSSDSVIHMGSIQFLKESSKLRELTSLENVQSLHIE